MWVSSILTVVDNVIVVALSLVNVLDHTIIACCSCILWYLYPASHTILFQLCEVALAEFVAKFNDIFTLVMTVNNKAVYKASFLASHMEFELPATSSTSKP